MFRPGKVLKVKVELSPEVVGFCRATILDTDGGHLLLQLKTSTGEKRSLPKGARVWFVSDGLNQGFEGLWSTQVLTTRIVSGKTAIECSRPKFESIVQRRRHRRVVISCPVKLHGQQFDGLRAVTRNLSKSGVGIEIFDDCAEQFVSGHRHDLTLETDAGAVHVTARVVQSRYNWLANKTDVGFEFVNLEPASEKMIAKVVDSIESEPLHTPDAKESGKDGGGRPRQLASWLKTTKDNVNFVKISTDQSDVLSPEDINELTDDSDEG